LLCRQRTEARPLIVGISEGIENGRAGNIKYWPRGGIELDSVTLSIKRLSAMPAKVAVATALPETRGSCRDFAVLFIEASRSLGSGQGSFPAIFTILVRTVSDPVLLDFSIRPIAVSEVSIWYPSPLHATSGRQCRRPAVSLA
jgi:hypothetical protein